ncbi:MAG: M20/M25/M40 family metallo-hydrolase [Clostridia bacterium]|nr:M20/M25/M40 family metallo-hydrolase [Clostridia bacterium]MBR5977059.1 M20/M25/M40 family metallo-hydrolase [Clostridia bacterium]MBR5991165.1 M20/M25/M40 family metallo-hydrolase [Clostridia bacterium]MBR6478961.1 M20/M25/M40 family metallo-hydrolase [Clostridia bacterium]MBR6512374.1 M20/M25/M40 family metallo-hydrolase [Clostridia bacterium]
MDTVELLRKLTASCGVSGLENGAAAVAKELLSPYVDSVETDRRGNVVGTVSGAGPKILLDAHLDQVGFIVTSLSDRGFVKFDRCGGTDPRVMSALPVIIMGKEPVYGVISSVPPHLQSDDDEGKVKAAKDLAIDTGLSKEKLEELVSQGDRVCFVPQFDKLLGDEICSNSLDDRAGIAILIRTLEILKDKGVKPNLTVTFSVQEEVGGGAVNCAAFKADVDMAIAVDVSFARTPGCKEEEAGVIAKGPMIGTAPCLDHEMFEDLKRLAKDNDIPYQIEVMNRVTGTHADDITVVREGIRTGLVSLPLKFMHTPVEVIDTKDIEFCAKLIAAFVEEKVK